MIEVSSEGIFCEDIRDETQGTQTIVGVFSHNVNVPQFPFAFPKLAFYARTKIPRESTFESLEVWFLLPGGAQDRVSVVGPEILTRARAEAAEAGMPFGTVISTVLAAPFRVPEAGQVRAVCRFDGTEVISGHLNFQPIPSSPLSAPLQPSPQSGDSAPAKETKRGRDRPSGRPAAPKRQRK